MEKRFCIYPLLDMNVTTPGVTPCCVTSMDAPVRMRLVLDTRRNLEEIWNSEQWRWWRERIANDDYSMCTGCSQKGDWVTEAELMKEYPDVAEKVMAYRRGDRGALEYPYNLVVSFDQNCNLKCVTCRPSDNQLLRHDITGVEEHVREFVSKVGRLTIAGDGEVSISPIYR